MKKILLITFFFLPLFVCAQIAPTKSIVFTGKFMDSTNKDTINSAKLKFLLIPEQNSIVKKKVRISFDNCPKEVEKNVDFYRSKTYTAKIEDFDWDDISIVMIRDTDHSILVSYTFETYEDSCSIMTADEGCDWIFYFDEESTVHKTMEWLQSVADQKILLDEYDEEKG